jgi:fructosamine-3-kinase
MTVDPLAARIQAVLGSRVIALAPLAGGCVGDVRAVRTADGSRCVAKTSPTGGLEVEGWMLGHLRELSSLPVPVVLHSSEDLLLLEYIEGDARPLGLAGESEAADLLAGLHALSAESFGLERDTVIGGLPQPNRPTTHWVEFFRDRRLAFMGRRAFAARAISSATLGRLERLCAHLDDWIGEPRGPGLVHGDVWSGNVIRRGGRVAAFVDPALYFADPDVELAFIALFSTFGDGFFARYREHRALSPDFFDTRRELYNLYPLLVHAELFGGHYGEEVDRTLRRFVTS